MPSVIFCWKRKTVIPRHIKAYIPFHTLTIILYVQVIGDGNLIMGSCHIAHDCKIGDNNIFANNTLLAGHVEVEVSCSENWSTFFMTDK